MIARDARPGIAGSEVVPQMNSNQAGMGVMRISPASIQATISEASTVPAVTETETSTSSLPWSLAGILAVCALVMAAVWFYLRAKR